MAITRQGDMRKGTRRHSGRRESDTEKIIIGGERDMKQEVTVRHEGVPQKKASSGLSWYEEFSVEWSETFLLKK
jgi:hypothetical protein